MCQRIANECLKSAFTLLLAGLNPAWFCGGVSHAESAKLKIYGRSLMPLFFHSLHACTQRQSMCLIISDSDIARMNMLWGIHDANSIKYNVRVYSKVKHFLLRASVFMDLCLWYRISLFYMFSHLIKARRKEKSFFAKEEFNKKYRCGDENIVMDFFSAIPEITNRVLTAIKVITVAPLKKLAAGRIQHILESLKSAFTTLVSFVVKRKQRNCPWGLFVSYVMLKIKFSSFSSFFFTALELLFSSFVNMTIIYEQTFLANKFFPFSITKIPQFSGKTYLLFVTWHFLRNFFQPSSWQRTNKLPHLAPFCHVRSVKRTRNRMAIILDVICCRWSSFWRVHRLWTIRLLAQAFLPPYNSTSPVHSLRLEYHLGVLLFLVIDIVLQREKEKDVLNKKICFVFY